MNRHTNPVGKAVLALKGLLCVQHQAITFPFLNNIGFLEYPGGALRAPAVASDGRWWPTFSRVVGEDLAELFGKAIGAGR